MIRSVSIILGDGAPEIRTQLRGQKIKFDEVIISSFQSCKDGIDWLRLTGIINGATAQRYRQKLRGRIMKHVYQVNGKGH